MAWNGDACPGKNWLRQGRALGGPPVFYYSHTSFFPGTRPHSRPSWQACQFFTTDTIRPSQFLFQIPSGPSGPVFSQIPSGGLRMATGAKGTRQRVSGKETGPDGPDGIPKRNQVSCRRPPVFYYRHTSFFSRHTRRRRKLAWEPPVFYYKHIGPSFFQIPSGPVFSGLATVHRHRRILGEN